MLVHVDPFANGNKLSNEILKKSKCIICLNGVIGQMLSMSSNWNQLVRYRFEAAYNLMHVHVYFVENI